MTQHITANVCRLVHMLGAEFLSDNQFSAHNCFSVVLLMFPSSAVDCPPLMDPTGGSVSVPGLRQGSTATYSCNVGYDLMGDSSRTCGGTGTWTNSEPVCQRESLLRHYQNRLQLYSYTSNVSPAYRR